MLKPRYMPVLKALMAKRIYLLLQHKVNNTTLKTVLLIVDFIGRKKCLKKIGLKT